MAESGEKLKVFISYSRRDAAEFADELVAGLELAGFAPFLDRHDIAAGEDWEARLGGLIEQSDTVVFVVSPELVKSERCVWEVDRTLGNSKRLLPVVFKPVPDSDIPLALSRLQFVRFDTGRALTRSIAELAAALRLDLDWIREHTRLGELAARWQARERPESLLLRGDDLDAAKQWAASRKAGVPEITEGQRALLHASDEAASARLGKERAQLEEMARAQAATARQQKRAARLLWGIAALVLAMTGYVIWQGHDVSRREVAVFSNLAAQAMNEGHFDRAMRYALQAYPARGNLPWLTPFSTELEGKLAGGAQSTRLHRLLVNHTGRVNAAAYSPDGTRILTASDDGTVRIWDAASGAEITVLRPQAGHIRTAVFSPDGKRVLIIGAEIVARIWNIDSGRELVVLKGHAEGVENAAFDRDGKRVVTAGSDNTARIWDAESGKELAVLKGHTFVVASATFNHSGDRVVTASWDKTARVWDASDGREIAVLSGHTTFVTGAAMSRDGKLVLTKGGFARLWKAETGEQILALKEGLKEEGEALGGPTAAFDPEEKHILAAEDGILRIWDVKTGRPLATLGGSTKPNVMSAQFNSTGRRVVSSHGDHSLRIWDVESGTERAVLSGHTRELASATFSPDGNHVLSASRDGTARIWEADDSNVIAVLAGHTEGLATASFDPEGRRVLTASDKDARIWDAGTGREIVRLGPHGYRIDDARFDPAGKRVTTVAGDLIRMWNAETGAEIVPVKGTNRIISVAFDRAGHRLATSGFDEMVHIWNAETGANIANQKHPGWVRSAEFDPEGKRVVSTIDRGYGFVWDAATLKQLATLEGHTAIVNHGRFDPQGKRVLTASWDGTARIWDAQSGLEKVRMSALTATAFYDAQFDFDASRVVTAAGSGGARIWDAQSGKEIAVLRDEKWVHSAAFSPDGRRIVTASEDKTARIWDVTWAARVRGDDLRERVCTEKLIGAAQEFTDAELENPILRDIDRNDRVARNPCLRRGPLSIDYWTRLAAQMWRAARKVAGW